MSTRKPIVPTRIIPGGAPLPAGPPAPGAVPPAVVVPAPAPPPEQIHHHHVHVTLQPLPYYEPIEPTRRARLWAWVRTLGRPWQLILALLAAVLPIPVLGYSAASTWAYIVGKARAEWGAPFGYGLAAIALALVVLRTVRHGGTLLRIWAGAVTLIGLISTIDLFDVVTLLTGVTR